MKIKKIILLLIITTFTTSCGVTYELKIKNENEITENVSIITDYRDKDIINILNEENIVYTKEKLEDGSVKLAYTVVYSSIEEWTKKTLIINYYNIKYKNLNGKVSLVATPKDSINLLLNGDDYYVSELDEIVLIIITPYLVLENNTLDSSGQEYTWKIASENSKDPIIFTFNKNIKPSVLKCFIISIILITVVVCVFLLYKKSKKNNSI